MQLVLPKGKVKAISYCRLFDLHFGAISIVFPTFLNMEVTINNQNYQLNESCSIEQMLAVVISTETNGLAIAVNQTIVSKSIWDTYALKPGDQVILIKATQGG